jgi:hypothetical protein
VTVLGVVGNERIPCFELETGKLCGVVGRINLVGFTEGDTLVLNREPSNEIGRHTLVRVW